MVKHYGCKHKFVLDSVGRFNQIWGKPQGEWKIKCHCEKCEHNLSFIMEYKTTGRFETEYYHIEGKPIRNERGYIFNAHEYKEAIEHVLKNYEDKDESQQKKN